MRILLLALSVLSSCISAAETLFTGGAIYTANSQQPWAEALIVDGNTITFVGSAKKASKLSGTDTRVVDISGRMLLPGFHDAHIHTFLGGRALVGCDLADLDSAEAITAKLKHCNAVSEGESWLIADTLNLGYFGEAGPDKTWLDTINPDRPILVRASDGHAVSGNSLALEMAGITAETPDPLAGVIERNADGSPSGTLRESAMTLLEILIPPVSDEERANIMFGAIREMNRFGITSIFDAWVGQKDIDFYHQASASGQLTVRATGALAYGHGDLFTLDPAEVYESLVKNRADYANDRFRLPAVKLFVDGVLEGETAALVSPYLHKHGYVGEYTYPQAELNQMVAELEAQGVQVYTHAIGDGGVRSVLDAFEYAREKNQSADTRHQISHLQLIHPDDHSRFSELGVVANFQALWALPDEWVMELNLPVVGMARVQRMYPINSIHKTGAVIVGGSDWNVSSMNPLEAIEVAMLRQDFTANDTAAQNPPVLNANERVSLDTMLKAYTINAAWSMHQDHLTGSLEVGKRADLVVLSDNLFDIPASRINRVKVLETYIDGEQVYPSE